MPVTLSPWPPSSEACACPGLPEEAESCLPGRRGHEGKNPSCWQTLGGSRGPARCPPPSISPLQPDVLVNKHGSYLAPSKEPPLSFQAVSTFVLKVVCWCFCQSVSVVK